MLKGGSWTGPADTSGSVAATGADDAEDPRVLERLCLPFDDADTPMPIFKLPVCAVAGPPPAAGVGGACPGW